jgi:CheY-like chemotaxis protein
MDLKMPVMSGFEATKIIKNIFPSIPIIALTAYVFEDDRQKAMSAGCDDFIVKPYRMEDLFERIIRLVS